MQGYWKFQCTVNKTYQIFVREIITDFQECVLTDPLHKVNKCLKLTSFFFLDQKNDVLQNLGCHFDITVSIFCGLCKKRVEKLYCICQEKNSITIN